MVWGYCPSWGKTWLQVHFSVGAYLGRKQEILYSTHQTSSFLYFINRCSSPWYGALYIQDRYSVNPQERLLQTQPEVCFTDAIGLSLCSCSLFCTCSDYPGLVHSSLMFVFSSFSFLFLLLILERLVFPEAYGLVHSNGCVERALV